MLKLDQFKKFSKTFGIGEDITPDMIGTIEDPKKIKMFGEEELLHIFPWQVEHLESEQIPHLQRKILIRSLKAEQVQHVKGNQSLYLFHNQLPYLTDRDAIQFLEADQLGALKLSDFTDAGVGEDQVHDFLGKLAASQYKHLSDSALASEFFKITPLTEAKISSFVKNLSGEVCDAVPVEYYKYLSDEQIGEITGDVIQTFPFLKMLSTLETSAGEAVLSPLQTFIQKLHPDAAHNLPFPYGYYKYMSEEQAARIPLDKIPTIPAATEADGKLISKLFTLWCGETVKPETRNQLLSALSTEQLNLLNEDQLTTMAGMDIDLLSKLSTEKIQSLTDLSLIHQLPDSSLSKLSKKQIQAAFSTADDLKKLTVDKIKDLHPDQISLLTLPLHIMNIPDTLMPSLQQKQMDIVEKHLAERLSQAKYHHDYPLEGEIGDISKQIKTMFFSRLVIPEKIKMVRTKEALELLTREQIQLVGADDAFVNRVPIETLKHLSDVQVPHLKKVEKFAHLRDEQLAYLSKEQVQKITNSDLIKRLPEKQIAFLTADQVKILESEAPKKVVHLKGAQIGAVTKALEFLTKDQLKLLNPSQVATISSTSQILKLPKDKVGYLSKYVINAISPEQVEGLEASSPTKLQYLHLPEQIQRVKSAFSQLRTCQFKHLSTEQIQSIKKEENLSRLSDEQLGDLLPAQVKMLSKRKDIERLPQEQYTHLTTEQVQKVSDPDIILQFFNSDKQSDLSLKQLQSIPSAEAIQSIEDLTTLQKLSLKQVAFLQKSQVKLLEESEEGIVEFINHLTTEQLGWLTPETVKGIKNPGTLSKLPDHQLEHLEPSQIKMLTKGATLAKLSDKQIEQITPTQVKALESANPERLKILKQAVQIQAIQSSFSILSKDQLKHLSDSQCGLVKDKEVVQKLAPGKAHYLSAEALQHIETDEQIADIEAFSPDKLKHLKKKEQIQKIQTFFSKISSDCIQYLTGDQVKKVNSPTVINNLTVEQLKDLPDDKIKHLTKAELIQSLPDEKLTHLSDSAIQHLLPKQVMPLINHSPTKAKYLKTEEQIQAIKATEGSGVEEIQSVEAALDSLSDEQLKLLSKSQIQDIAPENSKLIQRLGTKQIPLLNSNQMENVTKAQVKLVQDNKEVISMFGETQVRMMTSGFKHLRGDQLQMLRRKQVAKIRSKEMIPKLSDAQLKSISSEMVGAVSPAQVAAIEEIRPKDLKHLKTAEQVWEIAKTDNFTHLSTDNIPFLSAKQVKSITRKSIKKKPKLMDVVENLSETQLESINDRIVNSLSRGMIGKLPSSKLNKVSLMKIPDIAPKNFKKLSGARKAFFGFWNAFTGFFSAIFSAALIFVSWHKSFNWMTHPAKRLWWNLRYLISGK